jgi:hypothetical protein
LLRQVAVDSLILGKGSDFAITCLNQALAACPQDRKTRLLKNSLAISRPFCVASLRAWQTARRIRDRLHPYGNSAVKPVPAELSPVGK